jgi:ADP-heptose:LPS heptosyltransferase
MRLLVVKFTGLRGALAATAGLRTIRERHPGAQITFVTSPGSEVALEGCPAIIETIGFGEEGSSLALLSRLRRQRFDFAIALGGDPRANQLVALSGAAVRACGGLAPFYLRPLMHQQVFGAIVDPHEAARDHEVMSRVLGFHAETPAMWFAPSRMQEHGMMLEEGRFAVIHPGATRPERILEIDKWAAVARELIASHAVERIVISAGPGGAERIMAEALCGLIGPVAMSTAGRLRFSQLARLIKESRLFLGADSSVLQLAAAVGTPVVGVFGPSDYARARPWGTVHRVVRVDTTIYEGELRADYLARMDRALARITAQQVTHAAAEVIRITAS